MEIQHLPDPTGAHAPYGALIYLSVVAYPHSKAKRKQFRDSVRACILRQSVYDETKARRRPENFNELVAHADRRARTLFADSPETLRAYRMRPRDAEACVSRGVKLLGQRISVGESVLMVLLTKDPRAASPAWLTRFPNLPKERSNVQSRVLTPTLPVLHLAIPLATAMRRCQRELDTRKMPIYQLVIDAHRWLPDAIMQAERHRTRLKIERTIRVTVEP